MNELIPIVARTLAIGGGAVVLNLAPATLLAYAAAKNPHPKTTALYALVYLPLFLPPVALGWLLLRLLTPASPVGGWLEGVGWEILFTWKASLLVAMLVAFPLQFHVARQAFRGIIAEHYETACAFGTPQGFWLRTIALPLAAADLRQGLVLGFTRILGEFGATATVCGIIPGATETIATGIYRRLLSGQETPAWELGFCSLGLSLGLWWLASWRR